MSEFRSDFRRGLRAKYLPKLCCPKCPAANRPGATYIDVDEMVTHAYCTVCSRSGPIEAFLPKEHTP